jgi:hypothetical protein
MAARAQVVVAVAILTLGALVFAPVLRGYFLADDFTWVHDFSNFDWARTTDLLAGNWSRASAQEYRPLWALSFALDLELWGANPMALHISNLALHAIASFLVWRLALTASANRAGAGLLALTFFVLAPVHEEAVAWISARGHVLVTIFGVAAVLLLRRFETGGGVRWYLASLGATTAALTTQELAVAVPPLLLLRDVIDFGVRRPARLARLHAPFWLVLAAYFGLRLAVFGKLTREDTPVPISESFGRLYVSLRAAWFSPTLLADVPRSGTLALFGLTVTILALAVVLAWRAPGRGATLRGVAYFALVWPLVTVAPLVGANQQRHLYFSSVGIAVALGLAGTRLLATRSVVRPMAACVLATVLVAHALLLSSGIRAFARNGMLSQQLRDELVAATERSAPDPSAAIVVIPDLPNSPRHLWEYALPLAADPMFLAGRGSANIAGSFTSCHCEPSEWLAWDGPVIESLLTGTSEPVYLIHWDPPQAAFTMRQLDRAQFRAAYVRPGGPLLRARRPDLPEPVLGRPSDQLGMPEPRQ